MSDLLDVADRLYAESPATFTATRDEFAKAAENRAVGKQIKALKKPSVAAWAVNLLVRRETDQIEQVLGMSEALRDAAAGMDGDELRALTRQRRQLTTALASSARALAREHDVKLTGPVVDQVEDMLNAAMLDPQAAVMVRSGRLLTAFSSTGVSDLDPTTLVALPEHVDRAASPVEPAKPQLKVVPEGDAVRRARAEDALAKAELALQEAQTDLDEILESVAELDARRLQLAGEIDETKRRLAALEVDLDGVEDDLEDGEAARAEAQEAKEASAALVDRARAELAALPPALGQGHS